MGEQQTQEVAAPADPAAATGRGSRRRWVVLAIAAGVLAVAGATAGVFAATSGDKPAKGMTPELAVSFVQDEFPGEFPDAAKLMTLFKANCHVLDEGGTRASAMVPMIQGGLTSAEASYIFDISIDSTCPKYRQG